MGRKKRKSKTLTVPSSRRRHCEEEEHVEEWRDWASLPHDIVRIVLSKLTQIDILCGAGLALAFPPWRRLALEEPLLWRRIDLGYGNIRRRFERPHDEWVAMAHAAVDASAGRCESFRGYVVDEDILVHLANRHACEFINLDVLIC
jgi:hypothetical protein